MKAAILIGKILVFGVFLVPVAADDRARFHHVRLNTTDPAKSINYYVKHFGGVPIKFNGKVDSVFCERSFLLFNKVQEAPPKELVSGIWHIGWGGVDVVNEYQWMKRQGVEFHTPPTPLPGFDNFYMYIRGPAGELIEINTMGHHRFAHVHFFATDINATCQWYADHLGLKPRRGNVPRPKGDPNTLLGIWMNFITCDNVQMIFFSKPETDPPPKWWPDAPLKEIQPTAGRPIDHIAFSYREIDPVFERMKANGVTITSEPAIRSEHGLRSFFVEGPEKVSIEIVETKPIPEGIWEGD
jgi:catechol 2,3-dioxygenase-like lactoylglutathione lyase family enzyme